MIKKLTTQFTRYIKHPKDIEYFTEYPAPIMELIHSAHFININATIPFFGPMLYFLTRAFLCKNVLEIGTAEGYTSWYLANAVKDNAIRNNYSDPMFYGIDIVKTDFVKEHLDNANLPNRIINMNSIDLTPETFKDIKFDLIFQDGAHDTKHVSHEINILWPQLKGNGLGYWIFHDSRGPAEEGYKKILQCMQIDKIDVQHINLDDGIYGLGIFRKMEGFDYTKKLWVD